MFAMGNIHSCMNIPLRKSKILSSILVHVYYNDNKKNSQLN